jgi:succinyl-CoA synthetase beta subunit
MPLVVRLEGNNVQAARQTLAASGLRLIPADSMAQAAQRVVQAAASSV